MLQTAARVVFWGHAEMLTFIVFMSLSFGFGMIGLFIAVEHRLKTDTPAWRCGVFFGISIMSFASIWLHIFLEWVAR